MTEADRRRELAIDRLYRMKADFIQEINHVISDIASEMPKKPRKVVKLPTMKELRRRLNEQTA